jgi:hypothetical protein
MWIATNASVDLADGRGSPVPGAVEAPFNDLGAEVGRRQAIRLALQHEDHGVVHGHVGRGLVWLDRFDTENGSSTRDQFFQLLAARAASLKFLFGAAHGAFDFVLIGSEGPTKIVH